MRNQKGFTLVELLIVVGIIGILSVIAIPNFMKFQAKAKQTEAKINLSGLYTAEKAFFAEYNTFHSGLGTIGFSVDGSLRSYTVGYAALDTTTRPVSFPNELDVNCGGTSKTTAQNFCGATVPGWPSGASAPTMTAPTLSATVNTFSAGAMGKISNRTTGAGGTTVTDQWAIDENRNLRLIQDGT